MCRYSNSHVDQGDVGGEETSPRRTSDPTNRSLRRGNRAEGSRQAGDDRRIRRKLQAGLLATDGTRMARTRAFRARSSVASHQNRWPKYSIPGAWSSHWALRVRPSPRTPTCSPTRGWGCIKWARATRLKPIDSLLQMSLLPTEIQAKYSRAGPEPARGRTHSSIG